MFKVKDKDTKKIDQVLDTYLDIDFHKTYFLIWENNNWRWRKADRFVPPNIELKKDGYMPSFFVY